MSIAHFKYGKNKSSDFDIVIESDISHSSPKADVTFEKIDGRDGEVALTDGTLNNTNKQFLCKIIPSGKHTFESRATEISNWLKSDITWKDLYFSGEPDYIYQAIYHEEFDIEKIVTEYHKVVLTFTIKPYKFLKLGRTSLQLENTITNPTQKTAKPRLIIKGTGNITIQIGTSILKLTNVDGGIIVDSLLETVTSLDSKRPQWDKLTSYPLPQIAPGINAISKSGSITSIEIIPNWMVVV